MNRPPLDTSVLNEDHGLVELRNELRKLVEKENDQVTDHEAADRLLLEYIGDEQVAEAFNAIDKFYE
jgi:hypothetical protein